MPHRSLTIAFLFLFSLAASAQSSPKERHFTFHYSFTVKNVPVRKLLRVWIPLAHSGPSQDVRIVSRQGGLELRKTQDPEYGNWMLFAETAGTDKPEYQFTVDYDVVRREHVVLVNGKPLPDNRADKPGRLQVARFLQADKLVPITGLPAQLAAGQTRGANSPLEKARDIYDYVFRTMKYDKTGTGWGRGDTLWACDSKRGNCADFHSLFISMARSQQIPARFEMGFALPQDKNSAEIPSYHCWAEFYVDSIGWIPIDISEAWQHPELHDYYFGAHDLNRVQFTVGRDLPLNPPQAGSPLNYFIYPHVEVAGKEFSNVSLSFSFRDVDTRVPAGSVSK